ncbi:MAG: hypothetical protein HW404_272 [Anaerolineales bacterium]|nr:hypothetical protein [Anaerolineales bacterium]
MPVTQRSGSAILPNRSLIQNSSPCDFHAGAAPAEQDPSFRDFLAERTAHWDVVARRPRTRRR